MWQVLTKILLMALLRMQRVRIPSLLELRSVFIDWVKGNMKSKFLLWWRRNFI